MSKVNVTIGVDNRVVPSGGNENQVLAKNSDADYDLKWVDSSGGSSGGGGAGPSSVLPRKDGDGSEHGEGSTGQSDDFARGDHVHPINVSDDVTKIEMNGTADLGEELTYARTDHVHPHDDYKEGFVLYTGEGVNFFNSVEDLEALPHKAGRIAFVKVN